MNGACDGRLWRLRIFTMAMWLRKAGFCFLSAFTVHLRQCEGIGSFLRLQKRTIKRSLSIMNKLRALKRLIQTPHDMPTPSLASRFLTPDNASYYGL